MHLDRHILAILTAVLFVAAPAAPVLAQREGEMPVAQLPWWDRSPVYNSKYYNIKSDLAKEELAELANHLDRTFESYVRLLGSLRQRLPASFDVLIFAKHSDYITTLGNRYTVNATGSGGMFFSNSQGTALAFWTENLPKRRIHHVLQHEGFHQVAFALFGGNMSPWVNEGLAEFFGEAVMVNGRLVIGQTNPRVIQSVKDAIETKTYIPFLTMLQMDGGAWNGAVQNGTAKIQYEQAWSMVHFLVFGEGGKYDGMFGDYLRNLNAGFDSYQAFIRAFKTDDVNAFEARWLEFAKQAKPSSFTTAMERIEFLAAGLLELSKRKIQPVDFADLAAQLKSIRFTYTISQHGVSTVLSAEDDSLFLIPADDLTKKDHDPVFIVEKTSLRGVPSRELRLNLENPFPPTIRTDNLLPSNVGVRWIRDLEKNEFTFEIVVAK